MTNEQHVTLYYKEGKSDKVYSVHLLPKGSGYVVEITYGRRGSSLTSSNKTPCPVALDKATKVFNDTVHSKKLKGYTEGEGQVPYVGSAKEQNISGILPQLLNNIDEEDLNDYFENDNFCMQEKKDGKRLLLQKQNGVVTAINRKGLFVGLSEPVSQASAAISAETFVLDGEIVGDVFWVFDVLEYSNKNLRAETYRARYAILKTLVSPTAHEGLQLVATSFTISAKLGEFNKLKKQGVEGVVFKRLDAPYKPGRPSSGGDQLKFKFTNTCTCQVSGHVEGKRSVYVQMLDGKKPVEVGKVTILPNFDIPKVGALVEVRYLYRHVHGALYQPIYLGERDDISYADQVSTVKIKEGIDEIEEEN